MPRGHRSTTEYRFNEEQTDAIVRTATYHRKDFLLSVIWFSPGKHIDIRQSIATPFQRTSNIRLGFLDQLPLELLHDTLFRLDIRSLFSNILTNYVGSPLRRRRCRWHHIQIDCPELEKAKQLTAMAFEAISNSTLPVAPSTSANTIAKIARFEWELPHIEQETKAYQLLEGSELAPRFLGHIHEHWRIMNLLTEKIEGRPASFQDLGLCKTALRKLHELGHAHGNMNRYNFLITGEGVKLLDFEGFVENASPESMGRELESLRAELVDESGRGGGFIFHGDNN
ncbi:hypothetical protein FGADI_13417 [Fusarium gaditjirri]|uniref:Alpha-galactosidase A n=1 Tax=Fusarium gaditjirri TaxID=282569 RepID=A0A8H4WLB3_9HYPO|nr:hypothetical protein FGADI_13417 [Fusarium gaditjirri]